MYSINWNRKPFLVVKARRKPNSSGFAYVGLPEQALSGGTLLITELDKDFELSYMYIVHVCKFSE